MAFMDIEKSESGKLTLFSNIIPFIIEELVFALIQVHILFLEFRPQLITSLKADLCQDKNELCLNRTFP